MTYFRAAELRDDATKQFAHGGLMLRVTPSEAMQLHAPVLLQVRLPDGTGIESAGAILNVMPGYGVAVSITAAMADEIRRRAGSLPADAPDAALAHHEIVGAQQPASVAPVDAAEPVPSVQSAADASESETRTNARQIHLAMHGTRDERMAILRDKNRNLHMLVLRNPKLNAEDVALIAQNPRMAPELLKQIADRKEWFQRPAIALALCRNPKTPPDIAIRALDHVSLETQRQIAKGVGGALPHVVAAARKKIIGK